jgi:hypothetical protein
MTDTISIIECVATVRDRQTLKKKSKSEAWVMLIPHLQQYAHLKKLSICSSVIDIRAVYSICLYLPHIVKLHLRKYMRNSAKNNVQDKGAELIARHLLDLQILSLCKVCLGTQGATASLTSQRGVLLGGLPT